MKYIEMKAPAKINIGLNIVSKRDDGYHNLETFFYPIKDLYDVIKIRKSESFSYLSSNNELKNDENNLVIKAIHLLENTFEFKANVEIELIKNIPMGAGLGGGSSDAAVIILAFNDMFNLKMNYEKMKDIALSLGSDVPFFLKIKPAIGKSRGEDLTFTEVEINKPIVIINPGIHISTKESFSNIIPKNNPFDYNTIAQILKTDLSTLKNRVVNDFEEYAVSRHFEIKKIIDILNSHGALFAQMTGSGSTVFGIFDKIEMAKACLADIPDNYFRFISHREF